MATETENEQREREPFDCADSSASEASPQASDLEERAHILRQITNAQRTYDELRSVGGRLLAESMRFYCLADARAFWRESLIYWTDELSGLGDR